MNTQAATVGKGHRGLVLAMLLLVYTFNFLDRQILGILAEPIKADLGLSDGEFGAVGGLAFAILYSILGVPLALLADRTSRSWVITGALTVWSGFTALCGFATGFWHLFAFRLGVGIGEAGGVAPSYALIADYFPLEKRARALAIYSLGIPVGLALGTLLGAYIASSVDWRIAFLAVGAAGIVVAPIFRFLVRDVPKRGRAGGPPLAPVSMVFPMLAKKRSFWLMSFAAGFSSLCGYGLALWTPSVLIRSFGLDLVTTGQFLGSLLLIGGTAGVFAGGWLADRLGHADRRWYAWLPAIAWLITAPTFAAGLSTGVLPIAWALLLIPNGLNILWLGPVTTAVQNLVPPHMRATASGSFLMVNNLIGLGVGPWLMGAVSDGLKTGHGVESLRYAVIGCLAFYLLAAALMFVASRSLRSEWWDEEQGTAARSGT
ncbi:spinster family MFS transporter [Stakelama saccharophila]|uniref:MFS transporter n=1 Tax=Stakelama saccharophila TaxID=3075605 RepID=A0ABZ0BAQ3_9SPHN|nr:MFS transporter [Stakelama sp. W311]WNO54287.1 MFS transporter [Stakelama sp. W311]